MTDLHKIGHDDAELAYKVNGCLKFSVLKIQDGGRPLL